MDAKGERALLRGSRGKKLAVVVALQNALVAACLLVTLYVHWDVRQQQVSGDDVHVQFDAISDIQGNTTLQFSHIRSRNLMDVVGKHNSSIFVNCAGPYILYIDVCYRSLNSGASGALQLRVRGRETPLSTFSLEASSEACQWLHSVAYLRAYEEASLHLYSTGLFTIKNVTVGLNYLLGRRCEF